MPARPISINLPPPSRRHFTTATLHKQLSRNQPAIHLYDFDADPLHQRRQRLSDLALIEHHRIGGRPPPTIHKRVALAHFPLGVRGCPPHSAFNIPNLVCNTLNFCRRAEERGQSPYVPTSDVRKRSNVGDSPRRRGRAVTAD